MLRSLKLSHLFIRLGLAAVFLWFGIDKFLSPNYWINAWTPIWVIDFVSKFGIEGVTLMYFFGVFEIVIGVSLITAVFIRFFSFLAIMFLVSIIIFTGFNEVSMRDVGLIGGFLSLLFWSSNESPSYF